MSEGRVIQAAANAAHRAASKMDGSIRDRPPRNWLLDSMPKEVAETFSVAQLSAIDAAMRKRESTKLPVDFRVTVPFFRWPFFIVFHRFSARAGAALSQAPQAGPPQTRRLDILQRDHSGVPSALHDSRHHRNDPYDLHCDGRSVNPAYRRESAVKRVFIIETC